MARLVYLLTLLLLAGCASQPASAPGDPPPPQTVLQFLPGDVLQVAPNPNTQAEAVITASPDGQTLLTCFHGSFISLSPGYASTDGGATWQRVEFPVEGGTGGDCETAMLEDGSWVFLASTVAGATVLVSRDNGTTWTANALSAIPTNGLADRPWIHGVGNEIWLAYMPLNFQPGTVGFTKSTDHGQTWSTPIFVGTPSADRVALRHGHMAVSADGVHIPVVRYEPSGTGPRIVEVATTTDGGATWSIEEIHRSTQVVGDWPSMAVTQSGDQVVVVTANHNGTRSIFGLHRPPMGAWSDLFLVHEATGSSSSWPFIDGGRGHNATFITRGAAVDGEQHIWLGRIDTRDLSIEQWPLMDLASVEFASVDHDAAGNAYAVWTLSDAQYFVSARWTDTMASA